MSLLIKGATTFLALADTPAAFAGEGGKIAQVNVGENALEFAAKKLTYTQIYDGAAPSSGNLKPLGSIPYRWEDGSTGQRQMFLCVYDGDMYVGGGDGNGNGTYSKQFWKYNIASKQWTRLANLPGIAYFSCRPAYYSGKIYALCYSSELGDEYLFVYTIASNSWASYGGVPNNASAGNFICPTAAHLIIVSVVLDQLYELEYGSLATWNAKAATNGSAVQAQVISDEVYVLDASLNMYRYDEPTEALVDTGIVKPPFSKTSRMLVEDEDYIWVVKRQSGNPQSWQRSTGAAAFVEQLTFPDGDDCIEHGHGVLPSGATDWYVVYGMVAVPSILPDGCYARVEIAGIWELASQAFIQGGRPYC